MKCLFCDNEAENDLEICNECRKTFEQEFLEDEYPICGKCRTFSAECGCK